MTEQDQMAQMMAGVVQPEGFQMLDTGSIQLDSLLYVMDSLGYRLDRAGAEGDKRKPTGGFVTDNPALKANRNIGLENAVKIHNAPRKQWVKVKEGWYRIDLPGLDIAISAYALNILFARKLVEKVKLQKARTTPHHIKVTDHMVKPVSRAYIPLFGLTA
ncbi:hypothetical protein phiPsa374_037 [Pseudomonas phage phiPsa374]|uniref:DUF7390 domain-containing protein n=5 Tax=Otagovirus TaxID=2560197 RepID=A0A7G9V2C3_9CAUD|nr:hypothetical protein CF96_gp037 [Pseudomonas phage phiPsa374]YP_010767128.1 hypothetical protein QGX16_gp038 [Pseudomonas phage phiPsa397]YP_010767300.1 hypothetical protein QGX17_gp037 [Pseudomonas phage phiPsa381]YP_010767476.1 hypothetical protein QGX18_gp040 [Pseudomonas phage phiPsa347]YP_010767997.1 hypothetical protein QGX21_gp040 [Pseudomonas phage phiPsa315]AHJ87295.1 hypothetical protein phiPsa374_037 [Pseudomonas phage phiPsa374]QNO00257.1 hypothetical protein phiPsa315_040 [Pse